ncbi:MAG TPA: hypothetical protein VGR15_06605, partial [Bacteroidota bacterium]|nr:hypothetical protein [Bacteroidota bacterium]
MKCITVLFSILLLIPSQSVFGQESGKTSPKQASGLSPQNIPNRISYQGLLTTSTGAPATDGSYTLRFDLYSDTAGGFSYWNETQAAVTVHDGAFSVQLGAVTSLPSYIFLYPLYLQVTAEAGPGISSPIAFSPRTQLASVPYSLALRLPFTSAVDFAGSAFDIGNYGTGPALSGYNFSGDSTGRGILAASYTG